MPDELGVYVIIVFALFWFFIAMSGVFLVIHNRFDDHHGRGD